MRPEDEEEDFFPPIKPPPPPRWRVILLVLWTYRQLIGFFVAGSLLVFWGIPAGCRAVVDSVKTMQADRLARMGGDYMARNDRESARMSAETSLRLIPNNADALRVMAQIFLAEGRTAEALEVYQKLGNTGKATLPEFKNLAAIAQKEGYTPIANWISGWVAQQGEPDFPHLMRAGAFESERRMPEALAEYQLALQAAPNNRTKREMARFLLATSDLGESNAQVFSMLNDITTDAGSEGQEALVIGLLSGVVPTGQRPAWLERLRRHPLTTEQGFLIADAIEVEADPASKPRLVAEILTRVYGKSLEERFLAARWLLRHGEPGAVEKILPFEHARSAPEALALWMECQAALGNWQQLIAFTDSKPNVLASGAQRMLRGQALKKTGRPDEARKEYLLGLAECANDTPQLIASLAFLQSDGEEEIFREGARPLLSNDKSALAVWQSLAAFMQQRGDAKALRDFSKFAAEAGPLASYSVLLDDMAYWDLVLGRPVDSVAIEQRAANFKGIPAFRFTAALLQLRQGRKAQALGTFDSQKLRVRDLDPRHQLILACVLAANGQTEKAVRIGQGLEVSPLTKQERALLVEYVPVSRPGVTAP